MKYATVFLAMLLSVHNLVADVAGWEFQYEVYPREAMSDSIIGRLLFLGKELPRNCKHVITPIGEFMYVEKLSWTDLPPRWVPAVTDTYGSHPRFLEPKVKDILAGKDPDFRKCPVGPQESGAVSDEAFIPGKFEGRPKQAGSYWIFLVKEGWWVDPGRIEEVSEKITERPIAEPVQGWDFQYQVHKRHMGSETIIGQLLYQGKELPKEFQEVITPIGEFIFVEDLPWSDMQPRWVPMTMETAGIQMRFSEEKVKALLFGVNPRFRRGAVGLQETGVVAEAAFISAKFEERPKQAGPDWFYWVKQSGWANPKKVDQLSKQSESKVSEHNGRSEHKSEHKGQEDRERKQGTEK